MTRHRFDLLAACCAAAFLISVPNTARGQQFRDPAGRYFPLNQATPPGVAAQWHSLSAGTVIGAPQPVRIDVPGGGTVSVFTATDQFAHSQPAPAQMTLSVGHLYRLRLTNIPGAEGVELFPSLEVLDQLHPPAGMAHRYPVPVTITADEIAAAQEGRLVTKVIYLESPREAKGPRRSLVEATTTVPNRTNLFAEADRLGRPMLILRIGSRVPAPGTPPQFFGTGGPVGISPAAAAPQKSAQNHTSPSRVRVSMRLPASLRS